MAKKRKRLMDKSIITPYNPKWSSKTKQINLPRLPDLFSKFATGKLSHKKLQKKLRGVC